MRYVLHLEKSSLAGPRGKSGRSGGDGAARGRL